MAGDYHYDQKKAILDWQLPVIDASNTQGSLEFTMPGHPDDFYPINVSFYSPKTICGLQVGIIISFTCVCFCCHIYECHRSGEDHMPLCLSSTWLKCFGTL